MDLNILNSLSKEGVPGVAGVQLLANPCDTGLGHTEQTEHLFKMRMSQGVQQAEGDTLQLFGTPLENRKEKKVFILKAPINKASGVPEHLGHLRHLKNNDGLLLQKQKELKLEKLIRQLSILNGGDEETFLRAYIQDVITDWSDRLDEATHCFESILNNT